MAYAKTTPLQIALQLGIGVGVAGIFYFSLYKPENDPVLNKPKAPAVPAAEPSPADQLRALEQETKKTTAQEWGIDVAASKGNQS